MAALLPLRPPVYYFYFTLSITFLSGAVTVACGQHRGGANHDASWAFVLGRRWEAQTVAYCDKRVSPENTLLIGFK